MKNDDDFIHLPELYIKLGTLKEHLQKTYKLNINPMKNSDQNVNWSDLDKNLNAGYDDEKMAMISCDIIHEYAVKLDKIVKEDTELEEWVKSKISKTEQMMASVKHALIGIEKYDHGGELFKQQLLHIGKYAQAIIEVLQDGTELMSWMESNLAVCADHMDNVYHHLDYKMGNRAKDLDKMKNGGGVSETPIAMMREVTGKSVGTVPVSEEIYSSQVNDFVNYVYEVYAEQGYTKAQVKTAVNKYIKDLGKEFTYGGGDSLDRERVYEYLLNPSLKGIKNPMFANGGGVGSGIGMIELHFIGRSPLGFEMEDGQAIYINAKLIGHIYRAGGTETVLGITTSDRSIRVKETPEEIIELIKSTEASKMANGGNVGRDAMFRSQEPHEQRYDRKREYKEYKKEGWLANDWFDNGGGVGTKYYVMDAKSGDVVSKGFDTEEEAKVEKFRIFEETGNMFLTQKMMANGGGVGYFKSGYTLKGRKGKYWIDDVEGRVTKDRYFEKEEDAIAEIDLLSRFKKLKNEQRVKGPSMENLMEADRYYTKGGGVTKD